MWPLSWVFAFLQQEVLAMTLPKKKLICRLSRVPNVKEIGGISVVLQF